MEILYLVTVILFILAIIATIIIMKITYDSEIKLKKVSEKISDGYIIFNKSGKITNYNNAFLKFFNLEEKDVKKKNIKKVLFETKLKTEDIDKIVNILEDIDIKSNFELDIKNRNKTLKIEIMSLLDNDIFMRYVLIVKDVTKDYKIYEEVKANQEMLTNRERFATLRWIGNSV